MAAGLLGRQDRRRMAGMVAGAELAGGYGMTCHTQHPGLPCAESCTLEIPHLLEVFRNDDGYEERCLICKKTIRDVRWSDIRHMQNGYYGPQQ